MRATLIVGGGMAAVLATGACDILGVSDGEVRTLEVAAHKGSCFGLFARLCLLVRAPGEAAYQNLYDTPQGFEYEWGFEYVIVVEEHQVDNPPADGSSIRRVLRRVVSKETVEPGSTFDLTLTGGEGIRAVGDDRYTIFSGPEEIVCSGGVSCEGLATRVAEGGRVRLTLEHPYVMGAPFAVEGWVECEAAEGPC